MKLKIIYIPLCIYFNFTYVKLWLQHLLFTFHYVSISTNWHGMSRLLPLYLHSTMYLFQLRISEWYFIVCNNLHSTMYLFQPAHLPRDRCASIIYIPLCIYFNPAPEVAILTILIIYIPLCIYFNSFFKTCPYVLAIFTFHYVSISTIVFILLENHLVYLHSTMYLFQLFHEITITFSQKIYIPLCIYFNCDTSAICSHVNIFTFHYVSISTDFISDIVTCRHKFTFHYVSISTTPWYVIKSFLYYLHSTMYLFQLIPFTFPPMSYTYLHSTMYLFQPKQPTLWH